MREFLSDTEWTWNLCFWIKKSVLNSVFNCLFRDIYSWVLVFNKPSLVLCATYKKFWVNKLTTVNKGKLLNMYINSNSENMISIWNALLHNCCCYVISVIT